MSIQLSGIVEYININTAAFTVAIEKNLKDLVRRAAIEFLKSAAPRVRIRTGFAHGAFGVLADTLGVSLPPGTPGTSPRKGGEYYRDLGGRVRKNPTSGQQFTTPSSVIFDLDKNGNVTFKFDIDIAYFRKNDTVGHRGYPAWDSYREGVFAFYQYINTHLEEVVPNIQDYTTVVKTNF